MAPIHRLPLHLCIGSGPVARVPRGVECPLCIWPGLTIVMYIGLLHTLCGQPITQMVFTFVYCLGRGRRVHGSNTQIAFTFVYCLGRGRRVHFSNTQVASSFVYGSRPVARVPWGVDCPLCIWLGLTPPPGAASDDCPLLLGWVAVGGHVQWNCVLFSSSRGRNPRPAVGFTSPDPSLA